MAKTSLARQLELLKTPQTSAHRETKGSVSLLYDFFDAKSIDSNTHYSVALDGLEGLIKLDYSLARFKENLFHESSKSLDRSILSAEDNEKLDELIEEYLFTVVSKYFQLTDTMKMLEWLIYRHKIHMYNVDAYVGCVLPYHGTRQFARVLQTVPEIKDPGSTRWYWLKQIQMQAVPLSMNVLVAHCSANRDFFRYILDQIYKAAQIDQTNFRFASFLVVFCVKMLEHSKSEEVVSLVVSAISRSLRKNKSIFYSPSCILISHLSSIVQLDQTVLMKLLKLFSPRFTKLNRHKTFLALNIICKTQDISIFPQEFLSGIILQELVDWIVKNRNCDSLTLVLFRTFVHFVCDAKLSNEFVIENIQKILQSKCITRKAALHSMVAFINASYEAFTQKNNEESLRNIMSLFRKYYPLTLNSAIAELDSSENISKLLNSLCFSQVEKYNVPLFVGLEHSSKKVRRSSLFYLVNNFRKYLSSAEEIQYISNMFQQNFFDKLEDTSVDVLLEIFSVGEDIYELFPNNSFENIAFKVVDFCEKNLSSVFRNDAMEIDDESQENFKWFQLKKKVLGIFFSKNFTYFSFLDSPDCVVQNLFFDKTHRFRMVNFLFPSNESQLEVLKLLLSSNYGKTHPLIKTIKIKEKSAETDFEEIRLSNFETLVKYVENNLEFVLEDFQVKALDGLSFDNPDSYMRSLMFLLLVLCEVFKNSPTPTVQESVGLAVMNVIENVYLKFTLAKISRKTLFPMFNDSPSDCLQSCLSQNSIYECSKVPSTTLLFVLYRMISSYNLALSNPWSMFADNSNRELFGFKVFKFFILLSNPDYRDKSPSKHTFGLFQELFQDFLSKVVFSQKDVFSFFIPILIREDSDSLRLETLSLLNSFIQKDNLTPRFVDSFASERRTLIGYLLALSSYQQKCRQLVIENVEFLLSHSNCKSEASNFMREVLLNKEEIILDNKSLPIKFAKIHKSHEISTEFVEKIVDDLLEAFFNGSLPSECRCLVITLFTRFSFPLRERIFKYYHEYFTDFSVLNSTQERELHALLVYYAFACGGLFNDSNSYSVKFYLKTLSAVETCLSTEACILVFRGFELLFKNISKINPDLTMKITRNILEIELRLSESGFSNRRVNHMKLISWIKKSIGSVVVDGQFISDLMKNILNIEEVASSFAALGKDTPAKKKSKFDRTQLTEKFLRSWKLLRILIGCFQSNKSFKNSPILLKSLFDYFRLTFTEACDPSIMEHTRQVFLYAISHMIEIEFGTTSGALEGERKRLLGDAEKTEKRSKNKVKSSKPQGKHELFLKQIDIQVIVDCLSESRYQDTQKIALVSLSLLSPYFHKQILDSLVAIFTYIGTSLLQCDDQYSLAILYETVESIVPMILENSGDKAEERRHYILSIFLDSFSDIPSYRRLVLFTKLIHLLGEEKFLPFFIVLLFERKYLRFEKTKKEERDGISALGFSLFQAFPIATQIRSICALLSVFENKFFELIFTKVELKFDRQNIKKLEANSVAKEYKPKLKDETHQFSCGVDLLNFVSDLIANPEFRFAVNCLFIQNDEFNEDDETLEEKEIRLLNLEKQRQMNLGSLTYLFHLLLEMIVSLGPKEAQTRSSSLKFRRKVRHILDETLSNFNQLLPPTEILDLILDKMLNNSYSVDKTLFIFIQRRALRLMYEKLSALDPKEISRTKALNLLSNLLNQLPVSMKKIEKNREQVHNVQHLMLAFKACFKFLNDSDDKEENEMDLLITLLKKIVTFTESIRVERKSSVEIEDKSLSNLKGSCMICLVQVLCSMTTDGIEHLGKVVYLLLDNFSHDDEIVLLSNIVAISKVISKFGQFLSPYMSKIILALLPAFEWSEKDAGVKARLQSTWNMLAQDVPKRVLFEAISKAYQDATKISPQTVIELMNLMKKSCSNIVETEILMKYFKNLMLEAMNYRADHIGTVDLKTIENVETAIGEAFSAFFPKLNEAQFKPLFFKLHSLILKVDQSKENINENYYTLKKDAFYRLIAFYRFCSHLANSLKSLFCVFVAPLIVKNASEMLNAYHSDNNENNNHDEDETKLHKLAEGKKLIITDHSIGEPLIVSILSTFSKCFLFDLSGAFVRDDSINMIVKPLINQISNISGDDQDYQRRNELILQCTQYLIQNNKDETLIKEFNYQVLLKTREFEEKVRVAAIRVLHRLILTCAEEYLSFIPEAIPFISELCEDDSESVDGYLKKLIVDIEQLVGEPIKKYI